MSLPSPAKVHWLYPHFLVCEITTHTFSFNPECSQGCNSVQHFSTIPPGGQVRRGFQSQLHSVTESAPSPIWQKVKTNLNCLQGFQKVEEMNEAGRKAIYVSGRLWKAKCQPFALAKVLHVYMWNILTFKWFTKLSWFTTLKQRKYNLWRAKVK